MFTHTHTHTQHKHKHTHKHKHARARAFARIPPPHTPTPTPIRYNFLANEIGHVSSLVMHGKRLTFCMQQRHINKVFSWVPTRTTVVCLICSKCNTFRCSLQYKGTERLLHVKATSVTTKKDVHLCGYAEYSQCLYAHVQYELPCYVITILECHACTGQVLKV